MRLFLTLSIFMSYVPLRHYNSGGDNSFPFPQGKKVSIMLRLYTRHGNQCKRKFLAGTTVKTGTSEYAKYNIKSDTGCIWNCNLISSSSIKSVSAQMYNTESVIWTTIGWQRRCQIMLYHTELDIICSQRTYRAPQLISRFNFSCQPNFKFTRPT